jgi:hypothetical protein
MKSHLHDVPPEVRREWVKKSVATRQRNIAERKRLEQEHKELKSELLQEVKLLGAKRDKLQQGDDFRKLSAKLGCKSFYGEEQIVENAMPWTGQVGIYFLVRQGKVVYVGQSVNVAARVAQHHDKDFDSVTIVECDRKVLDVLESLYIHFLRPPLNGNTPSKAMSAPIQLEKLLLMATGENK